MIDSIRRLAATEQVRITLHAREEMDADGVSTDELLAALAASSSEIIEDYPEDIRGHSHLILSRLSGDSPVHVCCAVHEEELILITVYRPDPAQWTPDWRKRA